jgi:hypothetical protein
MTEVIDTRPAFEPVPVADLQEPIQNGKGKGKPLSMKPSAIRARRSRAKAKAEGRAPKTTARRARPSTRSLAPEIGAMLALVNGMVIASPLGTRPIAAISDASIPAERIGDELDAAEIAALAAAIDAQCRRSPRFRKVVEGMLGAASGGTLVTVVALIAARRAARHGLVPPSVDVMAGLILQSDVEAIANASKASPDDTPDPTTGETPPEREAETPFDYATVGA